MSLRVKIGLGLFYFILFLLLFFLRQSLSVAQGYVPASSVLRD